MVYRFKLLAQEGAEIEKMASGNSVDEALENILEECLLNEPGIFFEMSEECAVDVPNGASIYAVSSYGVYVKSVEVK